MLYVSVHLGVTNIANCYEKFSSRFDFTIMKQRIISYGSVPEFDDKMKSTYNKLKVTFEDNSDD